MTLKRRAANYLADMFAFGLRMGNEKTYRFFLDALWERYRVKWDSGEKLEMSLYCPKFLEPDPADAPLIERIFTAYEKASSQQENVDARFQPSVMWQNIFRRSFPDIAESLPGRDLNRFHRFLANFGSWPEPTGIEESWLIRQSSTDENTKLHLQQKIMAPLIRWWLRLESQGLDLSALEIPRHGNFGGTRVNGHVISPGSVFSQIYGRMLAGFVDVERPILAELGGGFGRLFYFLSQHLNQYCYAGFDLPETLCCASYYLLKSFPEKRFLLYGEGEWDANSLNEYDFILMPAFEITKLPDDGVDLFINENSLGNIEATACRNYIAEICRCSKSFWHRNHEARRFTFADGTTSLLNHEYPVCEEKFERIVRYCDAASLVRADRLNREGDMFWYYYRSRQASGC